MRLALPGAATVRGVAAPINYFPARVSVSAGGCAGCAQRLKGGLEFGLASRVESISRAHEGENQRKYPAVLSFQFPEMSDNEIEKPARERHVLLFHDDE